MINTKLERFLKELGGMWMLYSAVMKDMFQSPFYFRLFIDQIYVIGVKSMPLVLIVTFATGMVMSVQFGWGLEKFGGKLYVPKIVSLSLVRELGPVFACLMVAARVGAGITSEVGSMRVTQQIDAIRALGTSPIKRIVIPRILAGLVAVPIVAFFGTLIGVIGSMIVSATELGLDPGFYYQKLIDTIHMPDFLSGMGKTPFFGLMITLIGCFFGLRVSGGTQGVGNATTKSVVASCVLIVIGDFFLTKFFIFFEKM